MVFKDPCHVIEFTQLRVTGDSLARDHRLEQKTLTGRLPLYVLSKSYAESVEKTWRGNGRTY